MQIKIQNGAVDLSGQPILKKVDIEINTESKIGIVGRNGCGKTTLLRLISGEIDIVKDNPGVDSSFIVSGKPVISTLSQMTFSDDSRTMIDEIRSAYDNILSMQKELAVLQNKMDIAPNDENIAAYTTLLDAFTIAGGFYFEKEYESAIKKFGFSDKDKFKPLSDFSGGQRTKIALLKLLLSKPDLILLDEPTNHLDIEAVNWLEDYLSLYKKAVVIVSHDRMFLDKTIDTIYEIEHGVTHRYSGNYTQFVEKKKIIREQQAREYEAQQKELGRLNDLVERFRYKATKASMAQSKLKQIERMDIIESPESYDNRTFHSILEPDLRSVKDVLRTEDLSIGYEKELSKINLYVERGEHIGILGGNGLGKSTFLKTIVGTVPRLGGTFTIGGNVRIGYFDQQMAQYSASHTVLDDFWNAYPHLNNYEVRSALGAFLFFGDDVNKTVDKLSGGERVRLALCKIFYAKPNFLILDEPTNHMDILGKETLEDMLMNYSGTLIFVSHDRYFVKKVAHKILSFEKNEVKLYPFGYDEYLEKQQSDKNIPSSPTESKQKKTYTTPGKEKAKRERAIKKAQTNIDQLEKKLNELHEEINKEENISNYVLLTELQNQIDETEELLLCAMEDLDELLKI